MAQPIWKDCIVQMGGFDGFAYAEFTISYNDNAIYQGKAYPRPSDSKAYVKINDICADYIGNAFPDIFPTVGTTALPTYTFNIDINEYDSSGEYYAGGSLSYSFYYDWSYDYAEVRPSLLSAPILRKIPRSAPLLLTASGTLYIEKYDEDGELLLENEYNAVNIVENTVDAASVKLYDGGEVDITYEVVDDCYRYMLYYLNALGGWDFLLIEGKEVRTDNYTRHTFEQTYDNTQSRNRGVRNYRNDISRKWQLRTLWIDDAGAQNMHHLLGSPDVLLYDMQSGQLHPITIANTNCEYKTYSNQGNHLVRYDIDATLAKTLTRR